MTIIIEREISRKGSRPDFVVTVNKDIYIIENKIEIRSFLSLEIKNKGVYEDIPNILYALLLYITGAEGAGDIKIAGLSLDDLTT